MGYVPIMPPGLRVRPVPPSNQRGDDVGASIPPMHKLLTDMVNAGRIDIDEARRFEHPPFWTPTTISAAILALCLFSYGIGMWHGLMEGMQLGEAQHAVAEDERGT